MKKRSVPAIPVAELGALSAKELVGRLRRLQRCWETPEDTDLDAHELAQLEGITFKHSEEWRAAHRDVKELLAQREHVPGGAEKKERRRARARERGT